MYRTQRFLTAFALTAAFLGAAATANRAAAMTAAPLYEIAPPAQDASSVQIVHFICDWKCARRWPPRQYWQWDQRPVWDDPWTVLQPNIMGSPEPRFVPADRWAHEWHPPWMRYRHAHRHHH
jgi:hypothetical protein